MQHDNGEPAHGPDFAAKCTWHCVLQGMVGLRRERAPPPPLSKIDAKCPRGPRARSGVCRNMHSASFLDRDGGGGAPALSW
eukprot:4295427-Pyramimonas_sp.AAC.1